MTKVAAIQLSSTDSVEKNLAAVARLVTQACAQGAKLVVLPESFAFIGKKEADLLTIREQFRIGPIQQALAQLAKQHQVWIVGGTIPIVGENPNKCRAACLVFDDSGKICARYDKIHLFDVTLNDTEKYLESALIEPGDALAVVDTPFGKLGLAVCYDIRFPTQFLRLAEKGAQIFVIPAAFTLTTGRAHWEILTRSRAIDTFSYLVTACQVGKHANGRNTYGHSLLVDPWGKVIGSLADGEGIVFGEVDLAYQAQVRTTIPLQDSVVHA